MLHKNKYFLFKYLLTQLYVSVIIIIVNKRITDAIRSELLQIKMIYLDRYILVCRSFFYIKVIRRMIFLKTFNSAALVQDDQGQEQVVLAKA